MAVPPRTSPELALLCVGQALPAEPSAEPFLSLEISGFTSWGLAVFFLCQLPLGRCWLLHVGMPEVADGGLGVTVSQGEGSG